MEFNGPNGEYLEITHINPQNIHTLNNAQDGELSLLWSLNGPNKFNIDGIDYTLDQNQVMCLTEFHHIETQKVSALRLIRFNRAFFCLLNHDSEVGCKGVLFFGASNVPIIQVNAEDLHLLETVWKMFEKEMQSKDRLQLEMLQMMLKQVLILCTRMYKRQSALKKMNPDKVNILREFNFLVEQHFRTRHTVAAYAELLHKSPKSISNLFRSLGHKSPLQYIQGRKLLEARRLLKYTDKPVKAIAGEIGFPDIQAFSRFFKNQMGISPSEFRLN